MDWWLLFEEDKKEETMVDEKVIEAAEVLLNAFLPQKEVVQTVIYENKVPRMWTDDQTYDYIKKHDEGTCISRSGLQKLAIEKGLLVKLGTKKYIDLNRLDELFSGKEIQ